MIKVLFCLIWNKYIKFVYYQKAHLDTLRRHKKTYELKMLILNMLFLPAMEVVKGFGYLQVPTTTATALTTSIAGILRQTAEDAQILVVAKAKAVAL